MKKIFSTSLLLLSMIIISCNSVPANKDMRMMMEAPAEAIPPPQTSQQVTSIDRKIIRQGEIRFETSDAGETAAMISKTVAELNGYISDENTYTSDDRITFRVVIRVPADKFDQLLSRISESAKRLDNRHVENLDVTEEYIDIEARLKTKKDLENRYRELLAKAQRIEDMVAIEKEMGAVRAEIESMEARMKYLNDRIGFSTLTAEYYEMTSSLGFSSKAGKALESGWQLLVSFIIGLIHLWPFLLIIGLVIFIYLYLQTKKKNK